MATWKSAAELSRAYLVGADRLLDYSRRGNLPMSLEADGTPLFDEQIVARLFRSRRSVPPVNGQNLGVLGEARLGGSASSDPPLSARDARRRALRLGESGDESAALPRRTGTSE
jgi:hypothetical protein